MPSTESADPAPSIGDIVRLRPVGEADLAMFRRFCVEPGLVGLDWAGFRHPGAPARRFAVDGWLGVDDGRLVVEVEQDQAAGFVRACEFRAGRWRDGYLYSRLRDDPPPEALAGT
ncbi:hypothetical protein ACFY1S_25030 [Micromonospora sp. NPDC000663]|uniref:hypothetical protein n=1 Tax=Micromonospora sp. NPDC000663 TaxID=3364218 RepID=UPI0036B00173